MAAGEWGQRILCSDGSCIGLIGPDGTCKVCGRLSPNWADERERGLLPAEPDDDDAVSSGGGESWSARELCSDGGCIGVIGERGVCSTCGRPGRPAARAPHEIAGGAPSGESLPAPSPAQGPAPGEDHDDIEARTLCPDGACIGVLGDDGRCKVCGAEGA